MERYLTAANGVLVRLPPGFRFYPTDEELVVQYLRRKALSCPLPAAVIPEIDLGKYDPWDLPGCGSEGEKYFFTAPPEAKLLKGSNTSSTRAARSGYWKATGKERPVLSSRSHKLVGIKRTLIFCTAKPRHGSAAATGWTMHEYRLAAPETKQMNTSHICTVQMKDWVVCRIFKKKRATRLDGETRRCNSNILIPTDPAHYNSRPASPSPSSSSCLTDLPDEEEATSM